MKKNILERYERTHDGKVVIDVSASRVEDLYENFDKTAPYHKKDLDEDLVYYLTECSREIGREPFIIRFTLDALPPPELRERVRTSLNRFFMYQRELELASMKNMLRTAFLFLVAGIALLASSLSVPGFIRQGWGSPLLGRVISEGLTIGAWVSLWEFLATVFVSWRPGRQRVRLYGRLAFAEVLFHSGAGS